MHLQLVQASRAVCRCHKNVALPNCTAKTSTTGTHRYAWFSLLGDRAGYSEGRYTRLFHARPRDFFSPMKLTPILPLVEAQQTNWTRSHRLFSCHLRHFMRRNRSISVPRKTEGRERRRKFLPSAQFHAHDSRGEKTTIFCNQRFTSIRQTGRDWRVLSSAAAGVGTFRSWFGDLVASRCLNRRFDVAQ